MFCESSTIHPGYPATRLPVESYHLSNNLNILNINQPWPNESTPYIPYPLHPLRVSRSPSPQWPKKEVWRGGGGPDGLRGVSPAAVHDGHLGTGRSGRRGAAAEGAAAGPLAADGAVPMPAAGGDGWRLGMGWGWG